MKKLDLIKILAFSIRSCLNKRNKSEKGGKIIIIFGGIIGDSLVFMDALIAMQNYYCKKGKSITLVCRKAVASFLKSVRNDLQIEMLGIDPELFISDYRYFLDMVQTLNRQKWELLISPFKSKMAELIAMNTNAVHKLEMRQEFGSRFFSFEKILNKAAYNHTIIIERDCMAFKCYRILLNKLGITDYRAKLSCLPSYKVKYDFAAKNKYCVVCPTSSEAAKSWELDKFCGLIQYITESYNLDIYLCGGPEDSEFCELLKSKIQLPDRLYDYIGNTSFNEWVELIRHAVVCIGNDSASIHISAFTQTPSICITPGFFYGFMQPYDLDIVTEQDVLPTCVYAVKACFGCCLKDGKRCAGNKECLENVRKGGKYLCIRDITLNQVITALDKVI